MFSTINEAILKLFARVRDEEGQALAEYGLILGLIAVLAIGALTIIGTAISGHLDTIANALGGGS